MKKYSQYITVGFTEEGKRIRKRVYGNSYAEMVRNTKALIEQYKEVEHPSEITFKKYADKWLNVYKKTKEASTYNMYAFAIDKSEIIWYTQVKDIRQIDLQMIINDNSDHFRTCQIILLTLRQIFKHAISDGIISRDPTVHLELPPHEQSEQRVLKPEEIEAIKKIHLEPMDRMYVNLLYYLGLRPQEATALMISDFDLKNETVTVRRAIGYDKNTPYIKNTKTHNVRTLPIPSVFVPEVNQYLAEIKRQNNLYLLHYNRGLMSKTSRNHMWHRIKKEINLALGGNEFLDVTDGLRPYHFRHTYCTRCYYSGISLKKCQYLMGHSSLQMIMKVYAHLDNEKEPIEELKRMTM